MGDEIVYVDSSGRPWRRAEAEREMSDAEYAQHFQARYPGQPLPAPATPPVAAREPSDQQVEDILYRASGLFGVAFEERS